MGTVPPDLPADCDSGDRREKREQAPQQNAGKWTNQQGVQAQKRCANRKSSDEDVSRARSS